MKTTIANVKRQLTPGTKYLCEFIGSNRNHCIQGNECTQRVVVSNNSQLVSKFLSGPKTGDLIYLHWSGIKAELKDNAIVLTMTDCGIPEEFLKISQIGQI